MRVLVSRFIAPIVMVVALLPMGPTIGVINGLTRVLHGIHALLHLG